MALLVGYVCSMATTWTVLAVLLYGFSGVLAEGPVKKVRQQTHLRPPIVQTAIQGNAATAPISTDVSALEGTDDAQIQKIRRADAEKSKRTRHEKGKMVTRQRQNGTYPIALEYSQEPAYDPGSWHKSE